MAEISICIPIHDTPNTASFLSRLLGSLAAQTFKDYEIVITKEGPMARNHNAAIVKSSGRFVQMMQMDDYFAHPGALQNIVDGLQNSIWQITSCIHDYDGNVGMPHSPEWTDDIWSGNNRLGSISTLSFWRNKALLFEEPLQWVVDVDLYYRMFLKYGYPHINTDYGIVITERPDRLTNTIPDAMKLQEIEYLRKKYG